MHLDTYVCNISSGHQMYCCSFNFLKEGIHEFCAYIFCSSWRFQEAQMSNEVASVIFIKRNSFFFSYDIIKSLAISYQIQLKLLEPQKQILAVYFEHILQKLVAYFYTMFITIVTICTSCQFDKNVKNGTSYSCFCLCKSHCRCVLLQKIRYKVRSNLKSIIVIKWL